MVQKFSSGMGDSDINPCSHQTCGISSTIMGDGVVNTAAPGIEKADPDKQLLNFFLKWTEWCFVNDIFI